MSSRWCDCLDGPVFATAEPPLLDHGSGCGFPEASCRVPEHRMTVHAECGRPVEMRFCGCTHPDFGFTLDPDRGWWVHPPCGWPTRAWFAATGSRAPERLRGLRPVTFHEYVPIRRTPKARYQLMDDGQRAVNAASIGRSVRD